jgi:hypothetical protein
MPGLDPGIHDFSQATLKTWMAGTSPAMTSSERRHLALGFALGALLALEAEIF